MSDGIEKLSLAERIALVQALWDSIAAEVEGSPLEIPIHSPGRCGYGI